PRLQRDGVSTYLALIFGTLLSSQGADASFVPVSGPSGRFLRSCVSDSIRSFRTRFPRCFPVPALSRFSLPAFPTLSDPFGPDSQSAGVRPCGCWAVRTPEL
ncbi:hypothetical protein EF918_30900, partial [Streptomyces sp. WAC06614]